LPRAASRPVREIALSIACVTHPIGNLGVPGKLRTEYGANDTSGGYNLRARDPFATAAISGPAQNSSGSIMASTLGGREPILLETGEEGRFLDDRDEVFLSARAQGKGFASIGFGECRHCAPPEAWPNSRNESDDAYQPWRPEFRARRTLPSNSANCGTPS
jgi:hypothetical protein